MNIFKRLFKIGQAEANSAIDKLEDPIALTEQGIRDMKSDLDRSLQALAEVKALAIRSRNELEEAASKADDYQKKAMLILQKAQNGDMDTAQADRLATEALMKKDACIKRTEVATVNQKKMEESVRSLDANVKTIRSNISKWDNELKALKARVKVSTATKNINKQMAQIDSSGTVSMLEKMKLKVEQDEALAASYGEIAQESRSVDEEIDKVLKDVDQLKVAGELASLKETMGLKKEDS